MSIAIAAVVAAIGGVGARNIIGWLQDSAGFNIRHSAASAGIAVIIGIPIIITGFTGAFAGVETITEEAQVILFLMQVAAIAGFDALAKGGAKAAAGKKKVPKKPGE